MNTITDPTGTPARPADSTRVLVPSGVLGLGFDREALARGVALAPDIIAIDGGSTDSGPCYLGTATSKYSQAVVAGEWQELLEARHAAGVPLVIGSAGTCGTDNQVDALLEITRDWAERRGVAVRVATIRTQQDASTLIAAHRRGALHPLSTTAPVKAGGRDGERDGARDGAQDEALVDTLAACTHIVALAGAEAFIEALREGADVVIAGRATDTALIAALPLMRMGLTGMTGLSADANTDAGAAAGAAWHAAKIAECGALCSTRPASGVILVDIDAGGFSVQPLARGACCTPFTVSAHMLYENADPHLLVEPGGRLDVSGARYEALDERSVRVTGSRWQSDPRYTLKLEGTRALGHQCSSLVLVREPRYVQRIGEWCALLEARIRSDIERHLDVPADAVTLELRRIGVDATLGALEFATGTPVEVGILLIVTAADADTALDVARLANPSLLHLPLPDDDAMPSFAFPWSPAESVRGVLYGFCLDHVVEVAHPTALLRIAAVTIGAPAGEAG